jgi:hypothetical protein
MTSSSPLKPLAGAAPLLSLIAGGFALAAALTTLAWSGAFPAPPGSAFNSALAEARGWSAVSVLVVIGLARLVSSGAARRSARARLVLVGALVYLVYSYLELAVSPPFTPLSLVYIVVFACAIPALVMASASFELGALAARFSARTPRKSVAVFALLSSVMLCLAWLKGMVARIAAGDFGWPTGIDAIGHVVHALDLGLLAPLGFAAGLLLLRRRPAGYLVGAALLVNAACMGSALTAMVFVSSWSSGAPLTAALPFALVPSAALWLALRFLGALNEPSSALSPAGQPLVARDANT